MPRTAHQTSPSSGDRRPPTPRGAHEKAVGGTAVTDSSSAAAARRTPLAVRRSLPAAFAAGGLDLAARSSTCRIVGPAGRGQA